MIKDKTTIENDIDFNGIKAHFKNDIATFIEEDGLKIIWEDKWVHIRKSNTEPIIRIISEAKDNDTAENIIGLIKKIVSQPVS